MSAIDFLYLLDQSTRLITTEGGGAPRQADLRRSISTAYYSVFHMIATAAANQFVGWTKRSTSEYRLAYRSIDHSSIREICVELKKQTPKSKFKPYVPVAGMGGDFAKFASAVVDLRELRHSADYDPGPRFTRADAELSILAARTAIGAFENLPAELKLTFLALLVFRARGEE